jgi:hypothetical protein
MKQGMTILVAVCVSLAVVIALTQSGVLGKVQRVQELKASIDMTKCVFQQLGDGTPALICPLPQLAQKKVPEAKVEQPPEAKPTK